ncbi:hypothetical protein ACWDD9_41035 [Kitasatospora sp. NPDC001119]
MAGLGEDRRTWMIEPAAAAGHSLDGLLAGDGQGDLGANAMAAATVLHRAMLHVRMVRSPRHADRVPVRDFHRAFTGAGEAILAAGAHRLPHRREAAFRHLVETWVGRGGPALAKWFASELAETVNRPDLLLVLRDQDQPRPTAGTSQQPDPNLTTVPGPVEVELRMASYTSAHTRYGADHDASAPRAPGRAAAPAER